VRSSLCQAAAARAATPARYNLEWPGTPPPSGARGGGGKTWWLRCECGDGAETEGAIILAPCPNIDKYGFPA
jgi:hypothetical protein